MLVNGEKQRTVAVMDRGFQYGDGVFETIEIHHSTPLFLAAHLARLAQGCQQLAMPQPDMGLISREIAQLCLQVDNAVLKLIITRGEGGRGYRQPEPLALTRVLSVHPLPSYPQAYYDTGIVARFCQTRLGLNPALAGIKHLNRLEQVMARAEWSDETVQEGLMLNLSQHVIEGTMTNLFYAKQNVLYTAPIVDCGVAGIMRAWIMTQSFPVIEQYFSAQTLREADEIFVCNAIIGIWGVRELAGRCYPIGHLTQRLQHALAGEKQKQVAYANI